MPKVSVLMPLYKTNESHLRESIQSILDQTFTDFELLLLDDCPEDDRSAVVASFSDARIRYEKNERNMGITPSRNKLIDMAQGEYLATMDHDDISLPERLEKQVAYLDAHPDVGVVAGFARMHGSNKTMCYPVTDENIRISLLSGCALLHPASTIRKSVLLEHGIRYEERFSPCEDYALWCRLLPHTKFYNIPEIIFSYRSHPGNTSNQQAERMKAKGAAIWAMVRSQNPELWSELQMRTRQVVRIKLFGFIPLLKIVSISNRQQAYLFDFILLYSKKLDVKYVTEV